MDGLRLHGLHAGAFADVRRSDRPFAVSRSLAFRIAGRANRGRNHRRIPGRRDS